MDKRDRILKKDYEDEIDLGEVLKPIPQYKWSILIIVLISLLMAARFLYFKTPVYSSHTLIEVKSDKKEGIQTGDIIGSAFSSYGDEKVDKEMEILQTFHINNIALNMVNFHTRYFVDEGFKQIEIYNNSPLEIKNLTLIDRRIIWYKIKLTPVKDGYHLQVQNSFIDKILHLLFNTEIIELDNQKIYHYGDQIKNDYFELTVEKKDTIRQPFYLVLNTINRTIYENIKGNLKITQLNPSAALIDITYEDTIPQRADEYVNAVAESFILQSVAEKSKRNDRIIEFIQNQLGDIKTKLDNSEEKLEKYRIEYQAMEPTLQARTLIAELSKIEIELSQNELNEILIQNLLEFAKENKDLDSISPFLMELKDQPTLELITKLQEAEINEEGLKAQYSEKHPGVLAVRMQIKHIKKKIILNIENLKSSFSHRNANLEKLKITYEENLKTLPTKERTLINLKRDYEVSSETYNYLLKKKSENEMIKVAILSDYRIIDYAYSSSRPIGLKPSIILIIVLLLALILGVTQAIARNLLNDKVQNKKDIENLTTLPIYGILPVLKQKTIKLEVFKDTRSPFAESYRNLRTNLQFARKQNQANVILVTSTIAGEGKSTIAANLGAIFQMANIKTVVINLDLRKPTLHHYFNVDNSAGMSTYLSGKHSIEKIIQPSEYKNLDIIASGPIPPNPSELILTDKLDELMNKLKEEYDYIFIDSAPLGLVTDTMHLMQYADISLIVFRENYAQKSFVTDLNHLVENHDLKNIGIVINSVDMSSGGSYGYGYGYGYGDGDGDKNKNKINKFFERFSY